MASLAPSSPKLMESPTPNFIFFFSLHLFSFGFAYIFMVSRRLVLMLLCLIISFSYFILRHYYKLSFIGEIHLIIYESLEEHMAYANKITTRSGA